MRDFSADHRWLSINTATRARRQWPLDRIIDACARARHPRDLAVARPGRSASASSASPRCVREHTASSSRATAAAACSRRSTPPAAGRARRQPARRRRGEDARRAPAWCWSSAACPARSPASAAAQGHRARARSEVRDGIAATLDYARERRHAAGDRAAAPDVRRRPRLRQHAGAGARSLRRARPAREHRRARRARVDVYHVWWDPKLRGADRARRPRAPARVPRLRLARADPRPARTTAA